MARRIITLFVLCALVPTLATAMLSYERVHKLLLEQGYRQLAQMNEAYATALYDRLLAAHLQLHEKPSNLEAGPRHWSSEFTQHLRTRFDSIAIARTDGSLDTLLGSPRPLPELSEAERNRLAMGGAILKTVGGRSSPCSCRTLRRRATRRSSPNTSLPRCRPHLSSRVTITISTRA